MRFKEPPGIHAPRAMEFAARRADSGFTLLELVVVAGLIGTLSMIVIPRLFGFAERVRDKQCIVDIADMDADIQQFAVDYDEHPHTLDEIGRGNLRDPWGRPYQYLNIQLDGKTGAGKDKERKDHFLIPVNSDFDLYSMGPDGKSVAPLTAAASRDDIIRASNGSFIGPVSEF